MYVETIVQLSTLRTRLACMSCGLITDPHVDAGIGEQASRALVTLNLANFSEVAK